MLTIGSLFSGIGGLELGLEWAGLGPVLWQVEKEPWCRAVLKRHYPRAERHDDVCSVGSCNLRCVDLMCGGFPCQDVSSAGARKGLAGERSGLWFEYARIVQELRPSWVVVENVASGARLWVDQVMGDLGELGYAPLPIPLRADALGAPYPRARVFVVARLADADADGKPVLSQHAEVGLPQAHARVACGPRKAADADGIGLREQSQEWQGPPVAPVNRWREPMPPVGGVVPGPSDGLARRAAGNCVIPQCAEVIGYIIRELEGI